MKLFITATLLALGVGCLDDQRTGTNEEGTEIQCSDPGEGEARFADAPGYNPDGCSRTERMAKVRPFADDEADSELGSAEQPITIGLGSNASTSITVSNGGKVTGTNGVCRRKPDWIAGQPLVDRCIVPRVASTLNWAVFPDYPHPDDYDYVRARMLEAWAVWRQPVTCTTTDASHTNFTIQSGLNATGERLLEADLDLRFSNAIIPVYPVEDNPDNAFAAHTDIDTGAVRTIGPIRFGVQYYTYDFAGIGINHHVIEGIKMDVCVDPGDPIASRRLRNAYIWILAHELGHVFAMPHHDLGIMRKSSLVSCDELFASANTVVNNAPTKVQRAIVNQLRDSQTLLYSTEPTSGSNCSDNGGTRAAVDDLFFGDFF